MTHVYAWGNNPVRAKLRGRRCMVVVAGRMGSVLLEFEDGTRVVTSKRGIRKVEADGS